MSLGLDTHLFAMGPTITIQSVNQVKYIEFYNLILKIRRAPLHCV